MSGDASQNVHSQDGQSLLARLSTEMSHAQKEYFGKGPTHAKSYFLDDMLIVVMQGGLTTAEKTMVEFGEHDRVREFRQAFENHMGGRLCRLVEDLTGRTVLTYQSQIMFDPDRVLEIFVLDDHLAAGAREAAGRSDHVTDPGELDEPTMSGHA